MRRAASTSAVELGRRLSVHAEPAKASARRLQSCWKSTGVNLPAHSIMEILGTVGAVVAAAGTGAGSSQSSRFTLAWGLCTTAGAAGAGAGAAGGAVLYEGVLLTLTALLG